MIELYVYVVCIKSWVDFLYYKKMLVEEEEINFYYY